MVLSTQSLLYAVGLGAGSIPTAAALNWVLKDGLGQLGGVLFASAVNNRFDADPKRWRVVAAVALDGAVFLESLTPLAPALFLPVAAVANIGKNISWLAASASRAGIHLSFARRSNGGNLADITAKAGSQTTLASTLGMAAGVGISPFVGASPQAIIPCLVCISLVHLGCVLRSLRAVALNTLNEQRADIVAGAFVAERRSRAARRDTSVQAVAQAEVVIGTAGRHLFGGYTSSLPGSLVVGQPVTESTSCGRTVARLGDDLGVAGYAVFRRDGGDAADVALLVEQEARPEQVMLGHLHATCLRVELGGIDAERRGADADAGPDDAARRFVQQHGAAYLARLAEDGWNLENLFLEEQGGRVALV